METKSPAIRAIDVLIKVMVSAVAGAFVSGSMAGGLLMLDASGTVVDVLTVIALSLLFIFFATAIFGLFAMAWSDQ